MKIENLAGKTFGRLKVIRKAQNYVMQDGTSVIAWLCACDCGKEMEVSADDLLLAEIFDCGHIVNRPRVKQKVVEDEHPIVVKSPYHHVKNALVTNDKIRIEWPW